MSEELGSKGRRFLTGRNTLNSMKERGFNHTEELEQHEVRAQQEKGKKVFKMREEFWSHEIKEVQCKPNLHLWRKAYKRIFQLILVPHSQVQMVQIWLNRQFILDFCAWDCKEAQFYRLHKNCIVPPPGLDIILDSECNNKQSCF